MADRSVAVVLGTRPEIVKLAPVIRALGTQARVVFSGQHFDPAMSADVFAALGLDPPQATLEVGGRPRAQQIGLGSAWCSAVLSADRPAAVVVQGDTNTALAGALAANREGIPLVHVEAGLRSDDARMPEERNRILVDHLATLCCAPTPHARTRLEAEAIAPERIRVTGNPVVDAVRAVLPPSAERREILDRFGLEADGFLLATFHRAENVDDPPVLTQIYAALDAMPLPVVFPVHPRTAARAAALGLALDPERVTTIGPVGYRELLGLVAESAFVVSDSGGLQEEASVVGRPMLVVRASTERPEVLGTFAELVTPRDLAGRAVEWAGQLPALHRRLAGVPTPFGDGHAGERIAAEVRALTGR